MPDLSSDAAAARKAIKAMLREKPRPTQKAISAATGLTQGYVAKINQCMFTQVSPGVRKVLEYSKLSPAERAAAGARSRDVVARISLGAERLVARDPMLGEAFADFIERVAERASD